MRKLILLTIGIIILGAVFSQKAIGQVENEISLNARQKLLELVMCAQEKYFETEGAYYPSASECGSNVCWNTSSVVGSTDSLGSKLGACSNLNLSEIDMQDQSGDVRFRCRYQKGKTYCFAFRCENAEPAGCKQMWRIQGEAGSSLARCIDVGSPDTLCSGPTMLRTCLIVCP